MSAEGKLTYEKKINKNKRGKRECATYIKYNNNNIINYKVRFIRVSSNFSSLISLCSFRVRADRV